MVEGQTMYCPFSTPEYGTDCIEGRCQLWVYDVRLKNGGSCAFTIQALEAIGQMGDRR